MKKDFTSRQKEIVARKLGYEGPPKLGEAGNRASFGFSRESPLSLGA